MRRDAEITTGSKSLCSRARECPRDGRSRAVRRRRRAARLSRHPRLHRQPLVDAPPGPSGSPRRAGPSSALVCRVTGRRSRTCFRPVGTTGRLRPSAAYERLARRVEGRIVIGGLSMGGTLTVWLGARHPEVAGLVCINPMVAPVGPVREILQAGIDDGQETMPSIGSDIADPDADRARPTPPLRCGPCSRCSTPSRTCSRRLASLSMPVLLLTSEQDHVVPPFNSDHLAATVSGPVERVFLDPQLSRGHPRLRRGRDRGPGARIRGEGRRRLAPTMHPDGCHHS